MRASIWIWMLSVTLTLPLVATAEEEGSASDAPPAATTPPAAAPTPPAPASVPARGIQPTVTRLPSYWQCQDTPWCAYASRRCPHWRDRYVAD